jgi:hypothetical protein
MLAQHDTLWTLGTGTARAAIAAEIADLARQANDQERLAQALLLLATAQLEDASPAFRATLAEYAYLTERLRQPRHDYLRLAPPHTHTPCCPCPPHRASPCCARPAGPAHHCLTRALQIHQRLGARAWQAGSYGAIASVGDPEPAADISVDVAQLRRIGDMWQASYRGTRPISATPKDCTT